MSKTRTRTTSKRRAGNQIYSWDQPSFVVRVRPNSPVKTNRTVSLLRSKMSAIASQRKHAKGEVWKTRMTKSAVHLTRVA